MTKANRERVNAYMNAAPRRNLWEIYGTYSRAKANAAEYCKELCYKKGGRGLKFFSPTSFTFSAGFLFTENGVEKLMYITRDYDREIVLD